MNRNNQLAISVSLNLIHGVLDPAKAFMKRDTHITRTFSLTLKLASFCKKICPPKKHRGCWCIFWYFLCPEFVLWSEIVLSTNGQLVVWIPGIPLWNGLLLGGTVPFESQTTNPNHYFSICWYGVKSFFQTRWPLVSSNQLRLIHRGIEMKFVGMLICCSAVLPISIS